MNVDEIFLNIKTLPQPLEQSEVEKLFVQLRNGDKEAREKLIYYNIRIVLYSVLNRFKNLQYDQKDLVSIGIIGLSKAVDSFNISKNIKFMTYATRCIDNEILMYVRKNKKFSNDLSLDQSIRLENDGNDDNFLEDKLALDINIEEDYVYKEQKEILVEKIKELNERDREIIFMFFGFYNDREYTQAEIAKKLNISQSYVSRLIDKIVDKLRIKMTYTNIYLAINKENSNKNEFEIMKEGKNMKKLKSIYESLNASKEEVDALILTLTDEERELLKLAYGEDLEHPVRTPNWTKALNDRFYGTLYTKMKRKLKNPNSERKPRTRKKVINQVELERDNIQVNTDLCETLNENKEVECNESKMSKEDFMLVMDLLRLPNYSELLNLYSAKEAMIVALKLGYIDGKSFTALEISNFLGIDVQEVINITKRVLLECKNKTNKLIDEAIEYTLSDGNKLGK